MTDSAGPTLSVVIPTYGRDQILLNTIAALLPQSPDELLIVDQTEAHDAATESQLRAWDDAGTVRWIRLSPPSIPRAMNVGLRQARGEVVLFLDDDITPAAELVDAHREAHSRNNAEIVAVVGQVLQPGEEPTDAVARADGPYDPLATDFDFVFRGTQPSLVTNVMAGNLSVRRDAALAVGGFDEQFKGSAYRFETEFARRLVAAGYGIAFAPSASLRHLRAERGGTRQGGSHLTSASPRHGAGDYYFALRHGRGLARLRYLLRRPLREVRTKFHLRHPWYIPVKLVGELRALRQGWAAWREGPKLIEKATDAGRETQDRTKQIAAAMGIDR